MRHALPDGPGDKGDTDHLQNHKTNISSAKALIQYFKKTKLNVMLEKTLIQENDTRWNTLLIKLESVTAQEYAIWQFLTEKAEDHRLGSIDFGLLQKVIRFLTPFKKATKAMEGDKYPTIHRVFLYH